MRLPVAIMLAALAGPAIAAEPETASPPSIEYAQLTKIDVRFPQPATREALVTLEFDVLADGKTANITLVDDGYHERRFVDEAIRALKRSKWNPRRVNGLQVDSTGLRKSFRFSIKEQEQGITEKFAKEAQKVEDLLSKGDFAGAEAHSQWMLSNTVTLNYEYAILEAELAQTYAQMGRTDDALSKIYRATVRTKARPEFLRLLDTPPPNSPSNYLLGGKLITPLLEMRMRLLASRGFALEAMQAYYEMAGLGQLAPDDPSAALSLLMTEKIRGPGILRGKVRTGIGGAWTQYLSRRRFTLENVGGSIDSVRLMCEAGSQDLEYRPGEEWTAPVDWGLCAVEIRASPETSFEFVEFPDVSTPVSTVN